MNFQRYIIANLVAKSCSKGNQLRYKTFLVKNITEPAYLEYLNPQIPYYPLLNIQVRGYDYVVLENFARYIHRMCNKIGIDVIKFWCAAHTSSKLETLKMGSNAVLNDNCLNQYERNIQVKNLSAKMTPILIEVVNASLPPGVKLSIHQHDHNQHQLSRYIPDLQLESLQKELAELKEIELPDIAAKK